MCKSAAEMEKMRRSGHIVREVLEHVRGHGRSQASARWTWKRAAEKKIAEAGAKPAFKGYYDYPVRAVHLGEQEIVHGIPSEKRVLKRATSFRSTAAWCSTAITAIRRSQCRSGER